MILSLLISFAAFSADPKINDQFYQLDYRERISAEAKLPVIGGFEIQGSFETRYRPQKNQETVTTESEDDLED